MTIKAKSIQVYDLLETPGHISPRLYLVHGIHLGALNQEDVIELKPVDKTDPNAHGAKLDTLFVPKEMIEAGISAGIFNLTTL